MRSFTFFCLYKAKSLLRSSPSVHQSAAYTHHHHPHHLHSPPSRGNIHCTFHSSLSHLTCDNTIFNVLHSLLLPCGKILIRKGSRLTRFPFDLQQHQNIGCHQFLSRSTPDAIYELLKHGTFPRDVTLRAEQHSLGRPAHLPREHRRPRHHYECCFKRHGIY